MKSFKLIIITLWLLNSIWICWGLEKEKDDESKKKEMFSQILKKAEQGDAEAQYKLGIMYYTGEGSEKDLNQAVEWCQKAAEKGVIEAQNQLAFMYRYGLGIPKDYQKAIEWYLKAAEQGDADAQFWLGVMYEDGQGVTQDYKQAAGWYLKAAAKEDASAQFRLGIMFDNGRGVTQDYMKAAEWYRKAAEKGYANAQFNLGCMYLNGVGVPQDYQKSAEWYRKASERGCIEAQFNLGLMYDKGDGVTQDYQKAVEWYRKAAEQGYAAAQFNLGLMYDLGKGVEKDYRQAIDWYHKAAKQGHSIAQFNLGVIYDKGKGVNQDYRQAIVWYQKAAEQGDEAAQFNLGNMYWTGKGVIEDFVEAYKWYLLAGMNGYDVSKQKQFLSEQMTPTQIIEAQERAKAFVVKKEKAAEDDLLGGNELDTPKGMGTGFFIHGDGVLVTAAHVVEGANKIEVWADGKKWPARVVVKDAEIDAAIVKVEGYRPGAVLGLSSSAGVKAGDSVFTVGFPNVALQGSEAKYTEGVISSLTGAGDSPRLFQISVAVQPGNSGGPLLNGRGEVVGLVIAKLRAEAALATSGSLPENVNYAVKSSYILPMLETIPELADAKTKETQTPSSPDRSALIEKAKSAVALVVCY